MRRCTRGYVAIGKRLDPTLPSLFAHTESDARHTAGPGADREGRGAAAPIRAEPPTAHGPASSTSTPTTCRRGRRRRWRRSISTRAPRGTISRSAWRRRNEALPELPAVRRQHRLCRRLGPLRGDAGPGAGVYTDPYQYFGYLDSQLFRAIRLVVDTGIHSKGWTREQTIQYILDNSSRGPSNATAETERYIAIPGQALAYKIGQLKISELRAPRRESRWARSSTSANSTRRC